MRSSLVRPDHQALVAEATELVAIADLALVDRDYVAAAQLVEAAYGAFDEAETRCDAVTTRLEDPECLAA